MGLAAEYLTKMARQKCKSAKVYRYVEPTWYLSRRTYKMIMGRRQHEDIEIRIGESYPEAVASLNRILGLQIDPTTTPPAQL